MTGYSRNAVMHQGRLNEGVDLLQKPISQADLASRVRDALCTTKPAPVATTSDLASLVKAVGGKWQTLEGDDVAKTIFSAAVDQQITQIVVGTSRLTRWQSMTRGSVIQSILRLASEHDIDVHVIARRTTDAAWPRPVWGAVPAVPHGAAEVQHFISALRRKIGLG